MTLNTGQIITQVYQKITNCLNEDRYYVTKHARDQASNRGIVAPLKTLHGAMVNREAEIIWFLWEYPMDCLKVIVFISNPFYIHFAIMVKEDEIGITTVYLPTEFENDGKTRKRN